MVYFLTHNFLDLTPAPHQLVIKTKFLLSYALYPFLASALQAIDQSPANLVEAILRPEAE